MSAAAPGAPADRRAAWKIVVSVVVVMLAVGSLLFASTKQEAQYYKFVDEVAAAPGELKDKRIQVHGYVRERSIEVQKSSLDYRFTIESRAPRQPGSLAVHYRGIVPDTFKDGAEVVATGKLAPDGRLEAEAIMAKCPSKYEAKTAGDYQKPGTPQL